MKLIRVIQACSVWLLLVFLTTLLASSGSVGLWLMQSVPLLMLLPRLASTSPRPLQWLGFLVLFYFVVGVLQVSGASFFIRLQGISTLIACLVLFTAVIVRIRQLQQEKLNGKDR